MFKIVGFIIFPRRRPAINATMTKMTRFRDNMGSSLGYACAGGWTQNDGSSVTCC
jgi:hypothetical protein